MSAAGRYDILAEHRARHTQGEQIDAGDAADPPSDPGDDAT